MNPNDDAISLPTGSPAGKQTPALLANFVESAWDAIIAFDSRGQIEFWNPAAERMFGWKAHEALGKTSGELFWPVTTPGDQDDQKQWKMEMERGEFIRREQRTYRKDGSSFWVEYTNRAIFDQGGKAAGYVAVYHDISEHKRIEQALRENEERFRSMADVAPVMIWISGVDKLCTWFNQSWLNFVGRPLERELGSGWTENIHLDDFDRCLQTYNTAFDSRQPFSMVYRLKRWDGEYRWLLDNGVPSYGSSNEFTGYMGSCIDITEHKETEESLRAKTEEFETLLQVSPIAFFVAHDPECKRITGNPAGYQLVKLPEKGDKNISKSAPVEEQPGYRVFRDGIELASEDLPMQMAARLGIEVLQESLELRFEDASKKYIFAYARPLIDENGKSRGAIASMLDITERKLVEEKLRESEERYRTLFASMFEGFVLNEIILDEDGNPCDLRFLAANPAYEKQTGHKAGSIIGRTFSELYPDSRPEPVWLERYGQVVKTGEPVHFEAYFGQLERWFDVSAFKVGAYRFGTVFTDITERKQIEEQLERSSQKLSDTLASIQDDFYVLDRDWNFVYASRLFTAKVGKEPEDFVGNNIWKMFPKHVGTILEENFRAAMDKREVRRFEVGGKYTPAWYRMTAFPSAEGITVLGTDITERKHLEGEIEALARFPGENPNPVLRIHHDGVIAFANAASDNLLQFLNRAVGERLPEPEHKLILQTLESRLAIEQEVDCAGIIYSLFYTPIADSGYVNIYGRDITERKRADEALCESEERFRTLANTVPSIVWTAAPDGRILFTNEFWHKYTGSGDEEAGRNWTAFLNLDDRERSALAWKHATQTVTDYLIETRIRRHDGQYRWFQARALPVRDEVGNVTAWYGVAMDIHDRIEAVHALRESQQQLQFLNQTLELKVNAQTAEVRRLASNLTKAEQRERHRIAHILHEDLQQRLYAVKMQLAFLVDRFKNVNPTMELEFAKTNQQLDQILALTRNLTVELSPPILRDEGLTQALNWLASMMREQHGLQIEIEAEDSFAIPNKDIQVLLFACVRELLFNVVKHAGVNRAVVTLQRSNGFLIIEVCDEGKGFDIAELKVNTIDKVYDENSQWSFGLPTLRHQLGLLGGQMDIHSEPDAGTRITVTVPYS